MLTKEDLQAIRQMMREEISEEVAPINKRLDKIEENLNEVREATNYIADWVDRVEKKVDQAI